jgi:hypothetical protein
MLKIIICKFYLHSVLKGIVWKRVTNYFFLLWKFFASFRHEGFVTWRSIEFRGKDLDAKGCEGSKLYYIYIYRARMLKLPWKPGETRGCWEFPLVQMSPPTLLHPCPHQPPVSTPPPPPPVTPTLAQVNSFNIEHKSGILLFYTVRPCVVQCQFPRSHWANILRLLNQ